MRARLEKMACFHLTLGFRLKFHSLCNFNLQPCQTYTDVHRILAVRQPLQPQTSIFKDRADAPLLVLKGIPIHHKDYLSSPRQYARHISRPNGRLTLYTRMMSFLHVLQTKVYFKRSSQSTNDMLKTQSTASQ